MVAGGAVVTRTVYERRIGGFGLGRGQGRGAQLDAGQLTDALDRSLWPALVAGTLASLLVAAAVAWMLGGRVLRPLDDVRSATRRMARGDYSVRVDRPTETELASLADDVNVLGAHLAETELRRSHLLGEVTHEMRTPLTVIGGHVEAMLDGVLEPTPETLVLLADETRRLERLVDDLTLLSRVDEGTLHVESVPLDLEEVVGAVVARLRPQFEHGDVVLEYDSGPPIRICGDGQRLAQVLTNIVGNALEHTSAGGVVRVHTGRDAVSWVDVTDTGEGIPPDQLDIIFEWFHRAPSSNGRAGRGIGLTIARSLARAHGGDVTAHSIGPGHGATFRLTLPNA